MSSFTAEGMSTAGVETARRSSMAETSTLCNGGIAAMRGERERTGGGREETEDEIDLRCLLFRESV
jgi:hypothetical protein